MNPCRLIILILIACACFVLMDHARCEEEAITEPMDDRDIVRVGKLKTVGLYDGMLVERNISELDEFVYNSFSLLRLLELSLIDKTMNTIANPPAISSCNPTISTYTQEAGCLYIKNWNGEGYDNHVYRVANMRIIDLEFEKFPVVEFDYNHFNDYRMYFEFTNRIHVFHSDIITDSREVIEYINEIIKLIDNRLSRMRPVFSTTEVFSGFVKVELLEVAF